jgi:hypothetical protein
VHNPFFIAEYILKLLWNSCASQKNENESSRERRSPFFHMRIVFFLLIFSFLISCTLIHLLHIMSHVPHPDPVTKSARRSIGTVCDACGKQFATSYAFDRHRTSGYLIGTPCHVLDDGSTRVHLVATDRVSMSTAMLQKLKVARRKHGTAAYHTYHINNYFGH